MCYIYQPVADSIVIPAKLVPKGAGIYLLAPVR